MRDHVKYGAIPLLLYICEENPVVDKENLSKGRCVCKYIKNARCHIHRNRNNSETLITQIMYDPV